MKTFVDIDKSSNGDYIKLLSAVSKLSGLFSDSRTPYISYRAVENIFCKCFNADNLSRSDSAYDAKYNSMGIGIKTFVCGKNFSTEKIAEFNSLSNSLKKYEGLELAVKLAEYRNDRIELANRLYNIKDSVYHIVARREKELILFETDYNIIDIPNIKSIKTSSSGLKFDDGINEYSFNYSKSTLYRKFFIPEKGFRLPVEILEDPYALLLELLSNESYKTEQDKLIRGVDYVVLPLYGYKNREKYVFEKSGLNQWNASGRKRDPGEVYIKIPIEIHKRFPSFFPPRDKSFNLTIPTGEIFSAKVCQENSKALMTNPNKALSDWILRRVFGLKEGELLTIEKVNELEFDSVIIYKNSESDYIIDKSKLDSYEEFINYQDII
ncbi:MAG: hypothetical protein ACOYEA_00085 [Fermentimonas sp.]|jgi:hypothetical protein